MNIYVANLSFRIQDENLKSIFEEYGAVSTAKVIMDRETGKSRGFGFVEMPNLEEANKAITELNNAEWDGKVLKVTEARPKQPRSNNNFSQRRFNQNNS